MYEPFMPERLQPDQQVLLAHCLRRIPFLRLLRLIAACRRVSDSGFTTGNWLLDPFGEQDPIRLKPPRP